MEKYHAVYSKAIVEIEVEEICFVKAKDRDEARKKVIEEEQFGDEVHLLPFSQSFVSKCRHLIEQYQKYKLTPLYDFLTQVEDLKEIEIYEPVPGKHIFDLDDIEYKESWISFDSIKEMKQRFDVGFLVFTFWVRISDEEKSYFAMFNPDTKEKYYLSIR